MAVLIGRFDLRQNGWHSRHGQEVIVGFAFREMHVEWLDALDREGMAGLGWTTE